MLKAALRTGAVVAAILLPRLALAQPKDVDFASARRIIAARCSFCHSSIPQEDGLNAGSQPAKGVKFDTALDIKMRAPLILAQAVKSRRMPPGNATHMSDEERVTLGKWIDAGAQIP